MIQSKLFETFISILLAVDNRNKESGKVFIFSTKLRFFCQVYVLFTDFYLQFNKVQYYHFIGTINYSFLNKADQRRMTVSVHQKLKLESSQDHCQSEFPFSCFIEEECKPLLEHTNQNTEQLCSTLLAHLSKCFYKYTMQFFTTLVAALF